MPSSCCSGGAVCGRLDAYQDAADHVFSLDTSELRLRVEDDPMGEHRYGKVANVIRRRIRATLRDGPGLDRPGECHRPTHADPEHHVAVLAGGIHDVAQVLHDRLVDEDLCGEGGHRHNGLRLDDR